MDMNEDGNAKLKKLLLSGGAIVGAAALFNAFARKGVDRLTNLIGGEEGGFSWRGRRIAFTRRGSGPPVLLVHGIYPAAWSYEWRNNVDYLARTNTVYTIDLLGFGRSDRPAIRYSARLYISLISDFAAQVIEEPCVLIASSLSAAYALVLGARDPQRFPGLVIIAPSGLVRLTETGSVALDAGRLALDSPVLGTAAFNAMVSSRALRAHLRKKYSDDTIVTPELVRVAHTTTHQRGARHALAAEFAGQLNIDVSRAVRRLMQPTLLVWGSDSTEAPLDEATRYRSIQPAIELTVLSPAGDLPHDERADDFNVIVSAWLSRQSLSSAPIPATLPGTPEGSRRM